MALYTFLLYDDEAAYADITPAQSGDILKAHQAFQEHVASQGGRIVAGEALQPTATATAVRADSAGDHLLTDGPFAETKEALGGFYLVDATDLDQALAFAKLVPSVSGGVEVRPVRVF